MLQSCRGRSPPAAARRRRHCARAHRTTISPAIHDQVAGVAAVSGVVSGNGADRVRQHQLDDAVYGVDAGFPRRARLGADRGPRSSRDAELRRQPRWRSSAPPSARELFGDAPAIGQLIRIRNVPVHGDRPARAEGPVRLRQRPGRHRASVPVVDRAAAPVRRPSRPCPTSARDHGQGRIAPRR